MKTIEICDPFRLPTGFQAGGMHCGVKPDGKKDLALFYSDRPAVVAGTFTTNQVKAASVKLCLEHIAAGMPGRAVVLNSGCANACTGSRGMAHAKQMAVETARRLQVEKTEVYVCSTGSIGTFLPMDKIEQGIRKLAENLSPAGIFDASEAMMTTDTRPKRHAVTFNIKRKPVTLAGVVKGAGMIEPNMATMLCVLMTDVSVKREDLCEALRHAVDYTFNRITVDGDESTNDTVLCFANGASGADTLTRDHKQWPRFTEALQSVCAALAQMIVQDGEGATKTVQITVTGAVTDEQAESAARTVAKSMLIKTGWAGGKPHWGRVMDAVGYSYAHVVEENISIWYNDLPAVQRGMAAETPAQELAKAVAGNGFNVRIDLGLGKGQASILTCNCTEEYVKINKE